VSNISAYHQVIFSDATYNKHANFVVTRKIQTAWSMAYGRLLRKYIIDQQQGQAASNARSVKVSN